MLEVVRLPSERSASPALVLIDVASCSMRALSASAAARLRTSIWVVTASARPTSSSSNRPMRMSSRIADLHRALAERIVDLVEILAPTVSASLAPRALMAPVTSLMRLSSA